LSLAAFRWRKKRRQYYEAGHQRRSSGFPDEKDPMDFQDRGLPDMISARQFPGHEQQASQGSFSSMAILMGRVSHKRGDENMGSDTGNQFNKNYISKPMPREDKPLEMAGPSREEKGVSFAEAHDPSSSKPRPSIRGGKQGSTRRSSGWNGYWSGGSGMTILGFGGSKRTTYESNRTSDSQSHYSEGRRLPSQVTRKSALVSPLKLGERPGLNQVVSGSPTVSYQSNKFPLTKEMSGHIERPDSVSSMGSSYNGDRIDAFSSGIPTSINGQESWTPVDGHGWGRATEPSVAYSESVYAPTLSRSTTNFPIPTPARQTRFPGQPLYQTQASAKYQRPPATHSSDMSWLNLGGGSRI
jgi:hypothetical protein